MESFPLSILGVTLVLVFKQLWVEGTRLSPEIQSLVFSGCNKARKIFHNYIDRYLNSSTGPLWQVSLLQNGVGQNRLELLHTVEEVVYLRAQVIIHFIHGHRIRLLSS